MDKDSIAEKQKWADEKPIMNQNYSDYKTLEYVNKQWHISENIVSFIQNYFVNKVDQVLLSKQKIYESKLCISLNVYIT